MQLLRSTCRFLQRAVLELFEPELKLASVALQQYYGYCLPLEYL